MSSPLNLKMLSKYTCRQKLALRVEAQAHDFLLVAEQRLHHFAVLHVPHLGGFVEGARGHSVPERVVERQAVHHVLVALQRLQLVT